MIKTKTLGAAAVVVVMAVKLAVAAEPPVQGPCPAAAEVEGKTLTHAEKVELGRRVLTRCKAFSEPARYMSLHGYFAWLIEQSAEKLDGKNIRDMRDDAQGAFKVAAPDWKKMKVSKTRSGVYHGEQAVRTYRFAAAEARKMWSGKGPDPVVAPVSSAPRPAPVSAVRRSSLRTVPPPPVLTLEQARGYFAAPYEWVKSFLKNPAVLWNWIPRVLR